MIPRVFHRIWLGGQSMPDLFVQWGQSWLDLNPDWTMVTWTERNLPPSAHPDAVARACHLSQRSNVYRYEVLARQGGVYLDCDFQALRPLDNLLDGASAFAAFKVPGRPSAAILGCEPGHPFALELVRRIPERDPAISMTMGDGHVKDVLATYPEVKMFAHELLHPVRHFECRKLWRDGEPLPVDEVRAMFPRALACHYWSDKWYPPSFARISGDTMEAAA